MSIDEHTSVTGEPDPIASAEHRIAETRDHHIVITDLTERAHAHAKRNEGPLAGYTLAVKDNIDVADVRTTQGSLLYGGERALVSAPVVTALEAAGTATVAKVNLHEFAYGVSSGNAHFGAVRNPAHPAHTSGGSSGGSAAAVATGIARVALGTDTGGSVRIPAACVGVVGLRPRHGLLDPTGVFALAPSFDTVGPIAATVDDVERVWKALLAGAAVDGRGTPVARGTHFGPGEPRADDRRRA
ncbi:MAG TPA: amidase, partial [Nocardioidaceae bacterium]|nr:amidase [Nocardioidaceae bacterium]